MSKEDKWLLLFVAAALALRGFGAHVAIALVRPWVVVAMSGLAK